MHLSFSVPGSTWIATTTGSVLLKVTNTGPPEEPPSVLTWYAMRSVFLSAQNKMLHQLKKDPPHLSYASQSHFMTN